MNFSAIRQKIKPWMLPVAMLAGVVFHNQIGYLAFLSKYLIFIMLLITYCRLNLNEFRAGKFVWVLLTVQLLSSLAVYVILKPFDELLAQGAFICVFCPTATAAPVITGMLGGSVPRVACYSLFINVAVALLAPVLLSWMGAQSGFETTMTFTQSLWNIAQTVLPIILGPLLLAVVMARFSPRTHHALANHQSLSFYIWAFSLLIVVGNSMSFIMREPLSAVWQMVLLAVAAFIVCVLQFIVGHYIGLRYADAVSGAQSFGQKNTVLAIWLALTYLNPIVSVAPAAYVAWHNIINSWQIYRHETRMKSRF